MLFLSCFNKDTELKINYLMCERHGDVDLTPGCCHLAAHLSEGDSKSEAEGSTPGHIAATEPLP